jgi:hypothetical protein
MQFIFQNAPSLLLIFLSEKFEKKFICTHPPPPPPTDIYYYYYYYVGALHKVGLIPEE